ncbi:hypothetical protein PLEOSDRAFT_160307 [Pleurotus ostreatus PC15]|uniref:Uncharacterized protein n=1 Tax=Pleurotus ostreatus (strain PC15) TaxID=1137138 RepID=A0A067NCC7_PLEO1|nr:hypothetical protein PLEOSDRAFT_160307 [Pleurotus ostreatus PC15]
MSHLELHVPDLQCAPAALPQIEKQKFLKKWKKLKKRGGTAESVPDARDQADEHIRLKTQHSSGLDVPPGRDVTGDDGE